MNSNEFFAKMEGPVLGLGFTHQEIDCLCGKRLIKLNRESGEVVYEREVFQKEGLARILLTDNGQIFVSDFCTLYMFSRDEYKLIAKWQIGQNLSSDICGMTAEKNTVYVSVRNGGLVKIDRNSLERKEKHISNSSMWSLRAYGKYIVCGTVEGQLLLLDKDSMETEGRLALGKQNIRTLWLDGNILYAGGQDKRLFKISMSGFEVLDVKRNAHRKMFDFAGLYDNMLIMVSHPCSEIALWNKDSLEKTGEIHIPLRLSGCTYLDGNKLYICSRNIAGIGMVTL